MFTNSVKLIAGLSLVTAFQQRKNNIFQRSPIHKKFMQSNKNFNKILPFKLNYNFNHYTNSLNYDQQINQLNNKTLPIITNIQNQINTIQYQANNGIEDRLLSSRLTSNNAQIICVFDGHGGDRLSQYCQQNIITLLDQFIFQNKQNYINNIDKLIQQSLKYAYQQIQLIFFNTQYQKLVKMHSRKIKNLGTCALTVIIFNNKIYVANSGDSQAIAVLYNPISKKITYQSLNQRFSANNLIERQRLLRQFPNDRDIVVKDPNGCFYVKGLLQPTRSLGDYYLKYNQLFRGKGTFTGPYITSQPDIKIFPITTHYKTLIIASDGVWDYIKKDIVVISSFKPNPHIQILQQTLKQIAQLHNKTLQQIKQISIQQKRAFHDDISIAVVKLGENWKCKKFD